jgi:hypothetical protein
MAIQVYGGVEGIEAPEWKSGMNFQEFNEICAEYEQKIISWCKENSKHKLAGEVVSFPVADGNANYVIVKPSEVVHLATGDAWHYQYIDRLTAKDIEQEIKRSKALHKIFS